jgi:hypothetical protein
MMAKGGDDGDLSWKLSRQAWAALRAVPLYIQHRPEERLPPSHSWAVGCAGIGEGRARRKGMESRSRFSFIEPHPA